MKLITITLGLCICFNYALVQESNKSQTAQDIQNKKIENLRSYQNDEKSKSDNKVNELSKEEVKELITDRLNRHNDKVSEMLNKNSGLNKNPDLLSIITTQISSYPFDYVFIEIDSSDFNALLKNNPDILREYSTIYYSIVKRAQIINEK